MAADDLGADRADAPRRRLSVAEALAAVMALGAARRAVRPGAVERVPLDAALGRVLAEDVRAPGDLPPWDNASMDGWAVRADDVLGARVDAPVRLRVVGASRAGVPWDGAVERGTATRIATGAPLPAGADCVVRVEDSAIAAASPDGGEWVLLRDDRDARATDAAGGAARRNVRPRGEELRAGDVAVAAGTRLDAAALGVCASVGAATVAVTRAPRVAIVASGDELVPVAHPDAAALVASGARLVSSNSVTLAALVRAAGGEPRDHGIVPDHPDALPAVLRTLLRDDDVDVVLTTGGVSVGEHDHARAALLAVGGTLDFWRVRMRPGGPLAAGTLPGADGAPVPWLGLPGNPVSSMVTFALFGRPLVAALAGDASPHARAIPTRLAEPVRTPAPLAHYLRVALAVAADGVLEARLTGAQGSGLLTSMQRADALLVVPEATDALPTGAAVHVVPLRGALLAPAATPDPAALADSPALPPDRTNA